MKSNKCLLTISIIFIMVFVAASPATAEAPREYFNAELVSLGVIDPGNIEFIDNHMQVTGMKSLYLACWTFIDDGAVECAQEAIVVNGRYSLVDSTGPMWGTFEYLDANNQVIWKGTFHGNRSLDGVNVISTVTDSGRGLGVNEGLLFTYTGTAMNIFDPTMPHTFLASGYVLETGNYKP